MALFTWSEATSNFAQGVNQFGLLEGDDHKYSPSTVIGIERRRCSESRMKRATTSHVERQNLTIRMSMRRMTRLTNGFTKKLVNVKHSCALQFAYYNFCGVHMTLRVTPAMEAGLTGHIRPHMDLKGTHRRMIESRPNEMPTLQHGDPGQCGLL